MPQDNASVIVKRDTKSVIDQTPKVNGQMLWTTDIGQDNHIYTDVIDPSDNTVKRIQIGGILPETETEIQGYATSAQTSATNANNSATSASTSATNASNSATLAESYAKGGTNTRTGEDTDNAKYYKEQADVDATNASASATSAQTSATNASNSATLAGTNATNASNSATLSESYAKGGTGTRTGEDTDNAEYYKEQARIYAESASQGIQPATPSTIGGVKPDNVTITVDGVGAITAQEVQEITQANFDVLTTKNPKIAYFVKSSTSGTTGRIWYNDSWFGGTDITIDTVLDTTSNNPIANSAVATALAGKQNTLTTAQLDATNSGITAAKVSKLDALPTSTQLNVNLSTKANKSDITNISITGTTNNTGSNILAGTLFYLNGTLCKTLLDVADGATFTEGTNYANVALNTILKPQVISGSGNYGCEYRVIKFGNVVTLYITGITFDVVGQDMLVLQLPQEYRPREMHRAIGFYNSGDLDLNSGIGFNINVQGNVTTYSYKAFNGGTLSTTYVV